MPSRFPRDWVNVTCRIPAGSKKELKKILIDYDMTVAQLLLTFTNAIYTGDLKVTPNPDVGPGGADLMRSGVLDDLRIYLRDPSGALVNPSKFRDILL